MLVADDTLEGTGEEGWKPYDDCFAIVPAGADATDDEGFLWI
jgi:hypothetical protein